MARGPLGTLERLVYGNPLYRLAIEGRAPERLALVPPDPWSGDPDAGKALLDGEFLLAGQWRTLGADPWAVTPDTERVAIALYGFAWLSDLRALGSSAAQEHARTLLASWAGRHRRWDALTWRPDVLGRRLSNWLAGAEFLLSGANDDFRTTFMDSLSAQARHLGRAGRAVEPTAAAFDAIRGLIYAGLCVPGKESLLAVGRDLLEHEIERQILPDGGHYQRNPSVQLGVLKVLCDLRTALLAAKVEVPPGLLGAIDRITPMLRSLRHGDGGLALFNGSWEEDRRLIDTALSQAGVRGQAPPSAPHTGYQRLAAGRTVVLADVGGPPPKGADGEAHAGTLSFEMSVGKQRLIVNCGSYAGNEPAWRLAMRGTAAHSTLCLEDTNSSEIQSDGRFGARIAQVQAARGEGEDGTWLEADHDGYVPVFGLRHQRRLALDAGGTQLSGEDRLMGSGGGEARDFALRFHLHPDVQASLVGGGKGVLLRLPRGRGWRFEVEGGTVALEDSLYMGSPDSKRRCEQIVVTGKVQGAGGALRWRLGEIPKD